VPVSLPDPKRNRERKTEMIMRSPIPHTDRRPPSYRSLGRKEYLDNQSERSLKDTFMRKWIADRGLKARGITLDIISSKR